jgi:hypothetical protein
MCRRASVRRSSTVWTIRAHHDPPSPTPTLYTLTHPHTHTHTHTHRHRRVHTHTHTHTNTHIYIHAYIYTPTHTHPHTHTHILLCLLSAIASLLSAFCSAEVLLKGSEHTTVTPIQRQNYAHLHARAQRLTMPPVAIHVQICMYLDTHQHTKSRAHTSLHTLHKIFTNTHTHTHTHLKKFIYTRTHRNTHMHTHTQTHTHTHTHIADK